MSLPIEAIAGIAVAFGAVITLWHTISSSRIREITKDLTAADTERTEYVIRQIPQLAPDLSSALSDVKRLGKLPDLRLTTELRGNLEKLVSRVDDLRAIENAKTDSILALRGCRDTGLMLIAGLAALVFAWLASTYFLSDSVTSGLGLLCVVISYFWVLILGSRLMGRYSKYRKIKRLLDKCGLSTVGA
jgi:hypothetical protein